MNEQVGLKHVTLPITSLLIIVGNGVLIAVTLRNKALRTVTNAFVASLALCDLLLGCLVIPLLVLAEEGVLGGSPVVCLAVFCLTISNLLVSCLLLMAIAVERFVAIQCPLRHHALSTTRNAGAAIGFCWVYSAVVGCLPLAGWNVASAPAAAADSEEDRNGTVAPNPVECRYHTVIGGSFAAFMYPGHFVPLWALMFVLYGQIYRRSRGYVPGLPALRNLRRWSTSQADPSPPLPRCPRSRENWRAMRVLAVIVGYFVLSWLPVVVWYGTLYRGFTVEDARYVEPVLPYWFYNMGVTLAYGNSAVNPVLYGFGNRSVRKSLLRSVCGCWERSRRSGRGDSLPLSPVVRFIAGTVPDDAREAERKEKAHHVD